MGSCGGVLFVVSAGCAAAQHFLQEHEQEAAVDACQTLQPASAEEVRVATM